MKINKYIKKQLKYITYLCVLVFFLYLLYILPNWNINEIKYFEFVITLKTIISMLILIILFKCIYVFNLMFVKSIHNSHKHLKRKRKHR